MSKTTLLDALKDFDLPKLQTILAAKPELKGFRSEKGLDLLQICSSRCTVDDPEAAERQVRMAKWLVREGFDPKALHDTKPGEDGEEDAGQVTLAWFAVARAQNNKLARYFLSQGSKGGALFAAAWWGNADILEDLVKHGDRLNETVGATPLHMAIAVLDRGIEGKPERARRRLACVKEFLRLGADPNVGAFDGATPLHTALKKEYDVEVFTLLLQHGADPDVPGKDGRTVREIASRKRDKRYIRAIEQL